MSNSARKPWTPILWASALFVLCGSHAAAAVYNYEVTGTFPSDTPPTTFWAPNGHFEYRFSLEPQTLNYVGPESNILLPTEISYFLNGQKIAEFSDVISFSTGLTATGFFGTHLIFPYLSLTPAYFQGWFPGDPFDPTSPRLYSYSIIFDPSTSNITYVPTLYAGTFDVINGPAGTPGEFFGATIGSPVDGWEISDAVVRVSVVPEGSSLASMAAGCIPAISLWIFRRRYRST